MSAYPATARERTRWIAEKRGPKNTLDPMRPYAFLWEEEAGPLGVPIPTATVFLTNRECPYRCLMCDLWQNTLDTRVPSGAIAAQIRHALERLPAVRQIKIYNAGSFFDPQAIPPEDYAEIADCVRDFERVIVECHPALIGDRCLRFRALLAEKLEVAIGLETVHPDVLARLNKRFTVANFQNAAAFLAEHDIALRVFLLLRPPFLTEAEGILWAKRSLDTAFAAGASVCCVIPTRAGNGAMEALAASDDYAPPALPSLEAVQEYGLSLGQGRVFADLWDIEKFFTCACSPKRAARLAEMNRTQEAQSVIDCAMCP
ncbi:MAG: radical SAM protein [Armatimonadota bacterium]|nr:radical SAM protein [Armatimonadota bacterium]